MRLGVGFLGMMLLAAGCTSVYRVPRQVPAEIFLGENVRVVGVSPFKANDEAFKLSISEKLSSKLAGSQVFAVVDRTSLDRAMHEIEQSSTDYFDQATAVEFGKLVAAQALIIGHCTTHAADQPMAVSLTKLEPYTVEEVVVEKGVSRVEQVVKYREVRVEGLAQQRSMAFDLNVKAVHVETGTLVGGTGYAQKATAAWILQDPRPDLETQSCSVGLTGPIDARQWLLEQSEIAAESISRKLIPQTVVEKIEWETVGLDYAEVAEQHFKHGRFETCAELLQQDLTQAQTDPRVEPEHRAALHYLLGMTYACGQAFDRGLQHLNQAAREVPSDLHLSSIRRVEQWKKDAAALAVQTGRP